MWGYMGVGSYTAPTPSWHCATDRGREAGKRLELARLVRGALFRVEAHPPPLGTFSPRVEDLGFLGLGYKV